MKIGWGPGHIGGLFRRRNKADCRWLRFGEATSRDLNSPEIALKHHLIHRFVLCPKTYSAWVMRVFDSKRMEYLIQIAHKHTFLSSINAPSWASVKARPELIPPAA